CRRPRPALASSPGAFESASKIVPESRCSMQSVRKPIPSLPIVTCPEKLPSKYLRRTSSVRSLIRTRSASLTLMPLPDTRIVMSHLVLHVKSFPGSSKPKVSQRQPLQRPLRSPACTSCHDVAAPMTVYAWPHDTLPPCAGRCRYPPPSTFRRWRRRREFRLDFRHRSFV